MGVDYFLVWSCLVRFAWFYTKTKPIEDWIAWGCCRITKPNLLRSLDFAVSLRRSLHWLYVGESELRHESGLMALVNKGLLWSGQHVSNAFICCAGKKHGRLDVLVVLSNKRKQFLVFLVIKMLHVQSAFWTRHKTGLQLCNCPVSCVLSSSLLSC